MRNNNFSLCSSMLLLALCFSFLPGCDSNGSNAERSGITPRVATQTISATALATSEKPAPPTEAPASPSPISQEVLQDTESKQEDTNIEINIT